MSRGFQASVEQSRVVRELALQGYGAAQIDRVLVSKGLKQDPHPALHRRTIERMVQRIKPEDTSGPWTFRESTPEEAILVLQVLNWLLKRTNGRLWLSKDAACFIVKITRSCPTIPVEWAYGLALLYLSAGPDNVTKTQFLDLAMSLQPWTSQDQFARFTEIAGNAAIRGFMSRNSDPREMIAPLKDLADLMESLAKGDPFSAVEE